MAITYVGRSVVSAGDYNITVTMPAGYAAGDLLVLVAEGEQFIPELPSGWTLINVSTEYHESIMACYKFATASESSITVMTQDYSLRGTVLLFRGVSSTPINATTQGNVTGTAPSFNGVTTTIDGCMIVIAVGFNDTGADDTANYEFWEANLTGITEICDAKDKVGVTAAGGGIAIAYGINSVAGATGNILATTDSSSNNSNYVVFALAPSIGLNIPVKVGGVWKNSVGYVKVGGAWKPVVSIKEKVDDVWK